MSAEEKLQSIVLDLRILEGYYNEVATRESLLARFLLELKGALDASKGLPQDGTSDLLIPVGGGVFVHATAPPPEKLIVSVGADVALEKPRAEAQSYIEDRVGEIQHALSDLGAQRNELARRIQLLRSEADELSKQLRRG